MRTAIHVLLLLIVTNLYARHNGPLIPDASFLGLQEKERVGYALSGAGDVNGDGFNDFLIGTFHNRTMGFDAGAVYLILGREVLTWGMGDSLTHADARFLGERSYEAAGFWVSEGGDVNGDGLSDFLIGAPSGNDMVSSRPGKFHVILGKATADWGYNFILGDMADATYKGENGQDLAGRAVEIIGDINGDGCDEMLCSAPYNDYGNVDAGKVYLIPGKRDGWNRNEKLANVGTSFYYGVENGICGYSIAGLGDVNGDDVPDFAIGAPGANRAFVVFGRPSLDWGRNFHLNNADLIIVSKDRLKRETLGYMVATAGDVNGDGINDILVSAVENNDGGQAAGKVYLILGRDGGWDEKEFSLLFADASYIGENKNDQAGWDVSSAGDFNGDGYDDFLIGAWKNSTGYAEAGKAYLIYGKPDGWEQDIDLETIPDFFSGDADTNFAGYNVSSVRDLNGDEWDDFIVSAPYNDGLDTWSGQVYLFTSKRTRNSISGKISYFLSQTPVPGVTVTAAGLMTSSDSSDAAGNYTVEAYNETDCKIFSAKPTDEDLGDCISSYDAALVAQYSVQLNTLEGLALVSADVNLDGKITTYDASLILRYAVGYPRSWGSRVGDWIFSPDSIFISDITENLSAQDFTAIVRGDVDASWTNGGMQLARQNNSLPGISYSFDEQYNLIITVKFGAEKILSFDVHLSYDPAIFQYKKIEKCENFQVASYDTAGKLKIGAFTINPAIASLKIVFASKTTPGIPAVINIEKLFVNNKSFGSSRLNINPENEITFSLSQNYPNPFNNVTEIYYSIGKPGRINFKIFNTLGREVYTANVDKMASGYYKFTWNGTNNAGQTVASGVYIFQVQFGATIKQIKILYLK